MNPNLAPSESTFRFLRHVVLPVLLLIFFGTLLRTAWVDEDAYITFRTVENFVQGYGLRWNINERVQTFTHPLWLFAVAGGRVLTGEPFYSTLVWSLACSAATVVLLALRLAKDAYRGVFCVVLLLFSRAFVDFSTSGLENPLSHLLIVLFCLVLLERSPNPRQVFWLSLLTALAMTNRMDLGLLLVPALLVATYQARRARTIAAVVLGMTPFVLWEAFSLFYYGFLFPNTAYAKLNHGVSGGWLFHRGLVYLLDSVVTDPITLLTITLALIGAWVSRERRLFALAVGVLLYLIYVVKIGGDYMSGRFLAAPFLLSVVVLVRLEWPAWEWDAKRLVVLCGMVILLGWPFKLPVFAGLDAGVNPIEDRRWMALGVVDVRANFAPVSSLLYGCPLDNQFARQNSGHMVFGWLRTTQHWKQQQMNVVEWSNVGISACDMGPQIHVLDKFALCDPLLARLPAKWQPYWVAGHFDRTIPAGYFETLATGNNLICDKNLAKYYDQLRLITQGDLFDPRRLAAIFNFNVGLFDYLADWDYYRHGPRATVRLDEVSVPRPDGTLWQSPETVVMDAHGLWVEMGQPSHANRLEISLDFNDSYRIDFYRGSELLAGETVGTGKPTRGGLFTRMLDVPAGAVGRGYDRLKITPIWGDRYYGLGHVRLRACIKN